MRINYSKSLSIATVENKLVISKQLIKKLTKYKKKKKKKMESPTNETSREKIQPKFIHLSMGHLTKLQISL